eukprot:gene53134-6006_t
MGRVHFVTVRNMNILLCAKTRESCTAARAATLSSGERALDRTQATYDESGEANFATAKANIVGRTGAHLADLERRVAAFIHTFLGTAKKSVLEGIAHFSSFPKNTTTSWPWLWEQHLE